MKLLIQVGKREFYSLDLIGIIATIAKNRTRSEVKRMFKQKAIKIFIENENKT